MLGVCNLIGYRGTTSASSLWTDPLIYTAAAHQDLGGTTRRALRTQDAPQEAENGDRAMTQVTPQMTDSTSAQTDDSSNAQDGDRPMVYVNGKIVPKSQAMVSVFDHGLLYGDGVFEGIRG